MNKKDLMYNIIGGVVCGIVSATIVNTASAAISKIRSKRKEKK